MGTTQRPTARRGKAPVTSREAHRAASSTPTRYFGRSLSDIARGTGLSLSHVCRVFSGKRAPSMGTARTIAGFLGTTTDKLYESLPAA